MGASRTSPKNSLEWIDHDRGEPTMYIDPEATRHQNSMPRTRHQQRVPIATHPRDSEA